MPKVKAFVQLSEGERSKIEVLLHQGLSFTRIALLVGRSVSTICREVRRNGPKHYRAVRAQYFTGLRHRQKRKHTVFDQRMKDYICLQLCTCKWSPELISVEGRKWKSDFVSHEWIYRWIWKMKFSKCQTDKKYQGLYKHLKHGRGRRRRGRKTHMRGNIFDRRWIDERPKAATLRTRQGDLEADIILGKDRKPGLLVALDRKTRKTWIRKLKTKDAGYVMAKLIRICCSIGNVKTVTLDNDRSFATHHRLNKMGIETFFTHPYSSQEKGSVENRIGIIRRFFSKKTQFNLVNDNQVRQVQKLINQRPMRMFNYRSPNEIHKS